MGLLGSIGQAAGGLLGGVGRFAGLLTQPLTQNLYTDIQDPVARQQALLGLSAGLVNGAGVGGAGLMGRQAGQQYLAQQQAQQDEALKRQLMQAQIGQLNAKDRGKLVPVMGPNGPQYQYESDAVGMGVPQSNAGTDTAMVQEWKVAQASGFKGSLIDYLRQRASALQPPVQPSYQFIQDGTGNYAVGDTRSGRILPTNVKAPPKADNATEGERTSANYFERMQSAEGKLGKYAPSITDYAAAMKVMDGGAVTTAAANKMLSPEGQRYYQAAADWVRAKLRKESGAVISPSEMAQEIKTYFPVPGDTPQTIAQKAQARQQAISGMRGMGGRAVPNYLDQTTPTNADPLGILK